MVMPPAILYLKRRLALIGAAERQFAARVALAAAVHVAALAVMVWSETGLVGKTAFVLTWGALNFFWLAVLRRPAISAALSLAMIVVLILLSRFKHDIVFMTVNFVDVMVVDADTFAFLINVFPSLGVKVWVGLLLAFAALVLIWRLDPLRVRLRTALVGAVACLGLLTGLSFAVPSNYEHEFYDEPYVSKFARSGVTAVTDLLTRGLLESDAAVAERLSPAAGEACRPAAKPPHIVLVFDESSFDIRAAPGIKVPPDYARHFRSIDGTIRSFVVEGAGGPSWFTEYNVLTGLSVRSYGRFADFVTRIATGRIDRGLPRSLRRCGYRTFSLYSWSGAFLGARGFQTSTGIEHFLDTNDLGTKDFEPDGFYYNAAARLIARERGDAPLFLFVYTSANHFPWSFRFRPDLMSDWRDPGNRFEVDEYLRRQAMSARDYEQFVARLNRDFPGEAFLIVRFGDHQPNFAKQIIDPKLDDAAIARHISQFDPRYFTTYYAIDGVNFRPADLSSAVETLDAPYLPLVVLEAAGVPLDPSFAEQKKILRRCQGLFYRCAGGAEARRFNRLLIDAGLIKGL